MTNEQIILENRVFLMEQGILNAMEGACNITITAEDGSVKVVPLPEEIHTFQKWKYLGYSVKKGEHAIAKFPIWMASGKSSKDDDEEDGKKKKSRRMYMKMSFFFKSSQVETIAR